MYLKLCNKAFMQLTAINRLERFLGKKGLELVTILHTQFSITVLLLAF